jgi:hypothetical protein
MFEITNGMTHSLKCTAVHSNVTYMFEITDGMTHNSECVTVLMLLWNVREQSKMIDLNSVSMKHK